MQVHVLENAQQVGKAAAVLFAFFPNRCLVFRSSEKKGILRQFGEFVTSRIATLLIGEGLLFFLVDICHLPDGWMKPVVQVLIIVLNYLFSKLFVFKQSHQQKNTSRH